MGRGEMEIREVIKEGMLIWVGKGDKVRFWYDRWFGEFVVKEKFFRLFIILMKWSYIKNGNLGWILVGVEFYMVENFFYLGGGVFIRFYKNVGGSKFRLKYIRLFLLEFWFERKIFYEIFYWSCNLKEI